MRLNRKALGALGTAIACTSLAAVTIVTPLAQSAASAATTCSPTALPKSGKVNITFWEGMTSGNETQIQKLVTQYNAAQSKVHVSVVNQSGGYQQTWTNYLQALKNNTAPNVVMLDQYITQGAVDSKSIIPIKTCVAGTHYSTSTFSKKAIAEETVKGALQGMPFSVSAPILIYNQNAFKAAGITKAPVTVAQMAADAALMKNKSFTTGSPAKTYKLVDGMSIKLDPWWLQVWQGTGDAYMVDQQNGRTGRALHAAFNDSIGTSVFTQLQNIVKNGNAKTNPSTGGLTTAYANLFEIGFGKSGMTIDTSATLGTILGLLPQYPAVKLGVAAMPRITSTITGGVMPGGNALFMPKPSNNTTAKQAASWNFIQWLVSAQTMAKWDVATGYVPIRSDAATQSAMVKFWAKYPMLKAAYTEIQTGKVDNATAGPLIGNYFTIQQDIANAENNLLSPPFPSPGSVLSSAAAQVSNDLQAYASSL